MEGSSDKTADNKGLDQSSDQITPLPTPETAFDQVDTWIEDIKDVNTARPAKNLLLATTAGLARSYKKCNADFRPIESMPQRILTNPPEGVSNGGYDNQEANLICRVHDSLVSSDKTYVILDLLGTGTFGQVFRCKREGCKELFAVKVIKNKPAYHTQGNLEIKIAKLLNQQYDPHNERHIVRLLESFQYKGHICLVFELLSMSLLDLLTQNQFRGLPLSLVQRFTKQILTALMVFEDANVIHCDLKPENILLMPAPQKPLMRSRKTQQAEVSAVSDADANATNLAAAEPAAAAVEQGKTEKKSSFGSDIKVIDLGSACFEGRTIYSYIQSRFYRSPEVLLGSPYTGAIDMWSLACVCAEMYLGLPLFPGVSQHNQLSRIVEMFGTPPDFLIETKNGLKYFALASPPTAASSVLDGVGSGNTTSSSAGADDTPPAEPAKPAAAKAMNPFLPGSSTSASKYRIKTAEEYAVETNTEAPVLKKYLRYSQLEDVIMKCPFPQKSKLSNEQKQYEMVRRKAFLDFLQGLFKLNPFERWTAKQAYQHPFIQNTPFTVPYIPKADLKLQERKLMFMVQMQQRSSQSAQNYREDKSVLKGLRVPTNFGSQAAAQDGSSGKFVPLQFSHRRLSEPTEALGSTSQKEALASGKPDRPMLKRGDPVHAMKSNLGDEMAKGMKADVNLKDEVSVSSDVKNSSSVAAKADAVVPPAAAPPALAKAESPAVAAAVAGSPSTNSLASGNKSAKSTSTKAKPPGRHSFTHRPSNNQPGMQMGLSPGNMWQQPVYNNMPYFPPPWNGPYPGATPPHMPAPHIMPPPNMIPQSLPFFPPPPMDHNGHPMNPMMPPHMHDTSNPAYYLPSNTPGASSSANMATSFGPSSYSAMYHPMTGSMQEGPGNMIMTDFGMAMLRPEMDEQRLLMSQNPNMLPHWRPVVGSYVPYPHPGSMHPPMHPMSGGQMHMHPPPEVMYGSYAPQQQPMYMVQPGGYGQMMPGRSYDSKSAPQHYHQQQLQQQQQHNQQQHNQQQQQQQQQHHSRGRQSGGSSRRPSKTDVKAQQEATSYPDKPSAATRTDSQDGADEESVRSSFATQEPPSPARPTGKGGDSAADDLAAWDPFFESAD